MGTPEFAVPALDALYNSKNYQIVAVFTAKPKPKGRKMQIVKSPIHEKAIKYNIAVHTPTSLKTLEQADLINSIEADVIVVAAYGFIIPQNILDAKKYGCLNIHPSKLPKYRGAAPLQRTIINGDKETAICIMQMDAGLDTGDIILQENFLINSRISLLELHDRCAIIGAKLLLEVLDNIDELPRIPQDETKKVVYAHKLKKEEGKINWEDDAYHIDCKIRGMQPWPGVFFIHQGKNLQITKADYSDNNHDYPIGTIINDKFDVACGKGILHVKSVKPSGKKEMLATDYLRGINNRNSIKFKKL